MTSSGSDPPHTPDPPRYYGSSSWPVGFRGIGGDLIRPPKRPAPPPTPTETIPASHGAHLLSLIAVSESGARAAPCPVCSTDSALPPFGGWVPVCCRSCGTEFVATDGTGVPPDPPAAPASAPSPLAPTSPFDALPPLPESPRGFTSDVRTTPDGRRRVTCPQCRGAELDVPRGATVAVVLRCPVCHGPFLVSLTGEPAPPELEHAPEPTSEEDGRLWSACPKCGYEGMTLTRTDRGYVQTCAACGKSVTVCSFPPPPPAPPPRRRRRRTRHGPPPIPTASLVEPAVPSGGSTPRGRVWMLGEEVSCAECPRCMCSVRIKHEPMASRLKPTTCPVCGRVFLADLRRSLWLWLWRLLTGS